MQGKISKIFAGVSGNLRTIACRLSASRTPPILLYHQPPDCVLLLLQEEAIDLLGSSPKSILLKSKGKCSVSFRRAWACLVIQPEGLEMVSE